MMPLRKEVKLSFPNQLIPLNIMVFNHLIKIDNGTSKPTDFQQLSQRSVGLLVPQLCPYVMMGILDG